MLFWIVDISPKAINCTYIRWTIRQQQKSSGGNYDAYWQIKIAECQNVHWICHEGERDQMIRWWSFSRWKKYIGGISSRVLCSVTSPACYLADELHCTHFRKSSLPFGYTKNNGSIYSPNPHDFASKIDKKISGDGTKWAGSPHLWHYPWDIIWVECFQLHRMLFNK